MKVTWIRPSGSEIVTNDDPATLELAVSLGWKHKPEEVEKPKKVAKKVAKKKTAKKVAKKK